MTIRVEKSTTAADLEQCLAIRREVFVHEQQVPLAEELDGLDEHSEHYLIWCNDCAVGTTRVRVLYDYAKIERVALLAAFRGLGLGKCMMQYILADFVARPQLATAKLSAQTYAIDFYEKLGFIVCSDEYLDAGIAHKDMRLELSYLRVADSY